MVTLRQEEIIIIKKTLPKKKVKTKREKRNKNKNKEKKESKKLLRPLEVHPFTVS